MSLRAADSLHPGWLERLSFRVRHMELWLRWRRFIASDAGHEFEWMLAALMAAGVVFAVIRFVVTREG